MNRSAVFLVVSCFAFLAFENSFGQNQFSLDSELQRRLGEAIRKLDGMAKVTDKEFKELESRIKEQHLPFCWTELWRPEIEKKFEESNDVYKAINEKLDEHEKIIDDVAAQLTSRLSDKFDDSRIQELAKIIAFNESSITRVSDEIIPHLQKSIQENEKTISNAKVLYISTVRDYQDKYKSVCEQLALLKQHLNYQYQQNIPTANLIPTISQSNGTRRTAHFTPTDAPVQQARVLPSYVVYRRQDFCSTATLLQSNCVARWNDVTPYGIKAVRHFGDLYRDCGGRIVMLVDRNSSSTR